MTTRATTDDRLLTADQVAERWATTTEAVWAAVDEEENPLSFLYLGRGKPARGRRGQRGLYRFRLSTLVAWEESRERSFRTAPEVAGTVKVVAGTIPGWDGKDRLGGRRRKGGAGA